MGFFSLALGITLAILYTAGCSPTATTTAASGSIISVDLIHRDSIQSPFYNHGMTFSQRLGQALQRSLANTKCFKSNSSTYQTQILPASGEFLMNISFGNPSQQVLAIADTGSDLSWIQCKPRIQGNKDTGLIFNPELSSTYKAFGCKTEMCKTISTVLTNCSSIETCQFTEGYSDGSYSVGDIAIETVKLGGRAIQDIVFGCSFHNDVAFRKTTEGVIGLGGGEYSLVSQISTLVTPKFAYCLIPFPKNDHLSKLSSKLMFGDINFGSQAVSTPLVPKLPTTYYYITLEGITVGDTRLNYSDSTNPVKQMDKGNMILDSGTTLTVLPNKLYYKVEATIKENLKNVRAVEDPEKRLSLCYRAKRVKHAPKFTMHFEGADVSLLRYNIFVTVSKRVICLAMRPTSDDVAVLGNFGQSNFLVGYDLEKKSVSFRHTDCTRLKV